MRIVVKEAEHNIRLRFPTGLALNQLTAYGLRKKAAEHGVHISRQQAAVFLKALHSYRRSHPEWVLVDVQSAKGEHVQVKL